MNKINPHRAWLMFFGIWALLLTGMFDFWVDSPGLKQWLKVRNSLQAQRQEIATIESRSEMLQQVADQLEKNPIAQEREIRKVLGFLGENEVVFDFAP